MDQLTRLNRRFC